jgi:hypothetical protein
MYTTSADCKTNQLAMPTVKSGLDLTWLNYLKMENKLLYLIMLLMLFINCGMV